MALLDSGFIRGNVRKLTKKVSTSPVFHVHYRVSFHIYCIFPVTMSNVGTRYLDFPTHLSGVESDCQRLILATFSQHLQKGTSVGVALGSSLILKRVSVYGDTINLVKYYRCSICIVVKNIM